MNRVRVLISSMRVTTVVLVVAVVVGELAAVTSLAIATPAIGLAAVVVWTRPRTIICTLGAVVV